MPGSLKDRMRAFVAANTLAPGPVCSACKLPKKTLRTARELHAEGAKASVLARFLRKDGFQVSQYTLARHFRDHEQPEG